jgi:hypothetical protein
MANPEQQRDIIQILNSIPEYLNGVKLCNYQRITINVTKKGKPWFSYTSFNDDTGAIYDIQEGTHSPDISTKVEYSVLEEILGKKEELLQAKPSQRKYIAAKYALDFKMPTFTKLKILGTMAKNGTTKTYHKLASFYSQSTS